MGSDAYNFSSVNTTKTYTSKGTILKLVLNVNTIST